MKLQGVVADNKQTVVRPRGRLPPNKWWYLAKICLNNYVEEPRMHQRVPVIIFFLLSAQTHSGLKLVVTRERHLQKHAEFES